MIGARSQPRKWAAAAAFSVAVHTAAAVWFVWRPDFGSMLPGPAAEPVQMEISALTMPPAVAPVVSDPVQVAAAPVEFMSTAVPETSPGAATTETLAALPPWGLLPDLVDPGLVTALDPAGGAGGEGPDQEPDAPGVADPDLSPDPTAGITTGTPADPRLAPLIDRIRDQLSAPCLLALPMLDAQGDVSLLVLSDSDRDLTSLTGQLTQGLDMPVTQTSALLDPRQCPAVAFARRDPRYPVLPLALSTNAVELPPGGTLSGQIVGGGGYYTTLLLVDDNGVVHDLRRFLVNSAGRVSFDLPMIRDGAARDTRQLLVALSTPARPDTVTRRAGEAAGPFFDALFAEIGQTALVGVASVYVR